MIQISQQLVGALLLFILYIVLRCLYNLYLHPLSKFPGPIFWRATRLGYVLCTWKGWLHKDVQKLHELYGEIVRIAPDELSFAHPDAWTDIYSNRSGGKAFPKTQVWHETLLGRPPSLLNQIHSSQHARVRRALEPGFGVRALGYQEVVLQKYTAIFISKLRDRFGSDSGKHIVIETVEWLRLVVFDIIGELGFGETFQCLENNQYHAWMDVIFKHFNQCSQWIGLDWI